MLNSNYAQADKIFYGEVSAMCALMRVSSNTCWLYIVKNSTDIVHEICLI